MKYEFEAGKTYWGRFIGEADEDGGFNIFEMKVISRTKKTIFAQVEGKIPKRFVTKMDGNGCEFVMPFGRYSMAPSVDADHIAHIEGGRK